jgi:hypothetical protein
MTQHVNKNRMLWWCFLACWTHILLPTTLGKIRTSPSYLFDPASRLSGCWRASCTLHYYGYLLAARERIAVTTCLGCSYMGVASNLSTCQWFWRCYPEMFRPRLFRPRAPWIRSSYMSSSHPLHRVFHNRINDEKYTFLMNYFTHVLPVSPYHLNPVLWSLLLPLLPTNGINTPEMLTTSTYSDLKRMCKRTYILILTLLKQIRRMWVASWIPKTSTS